ncbi:diacylglycerol kinase family protein [Parabacteroides sp. PF5-9]|uniref:diacylglycerol kinase family protein n=1 Tax=Parabacteroides sp. PF5-9 TaxID=1742404 RepID=UPI002472F9DB|nr:diacylglycerol kinase family protein [Parabacteroides sp. PF5-9]MDH6357680.1 diacylglycerol kinase (ATP) [Parabacteroides sp. PF5-9]
MKNNSFSFRKRLKSFRYAFNGIGLLFKQEHNSWIHCFAAICAIIAGLLLDISNIEWVAVAVVIGMVLSAEAMNSAIELICDYICPEYHHQMKQIKDLAAAAVLFTAIIAAVVGLIIFIPKLIPYFS